MSARAPKPLPPPTDEERRTAAEAAQALRAALADRSTMGRKLVVHLDLARPRRGVWTGLPGFSRESGRYHHTSLPGWTYSRAEVLAEMIPDLEALAERGVRPTEVTSQAGAA